MSIGLALATLALWVLPEIHRVSASGTHVGEASQSGGAAQAEPAEPAGPQGAAPASMEIRGQRMDVWPIENLIARGIEIKLMPPEENAAPHYVEAVNAFLDVPETLRPVFEFAYGEAWPGDAPELAEWLTRAENQRAITAADRASRMPHCQLPYFGDPEQSIVSLLLPNLSHLRMLSRIIVADGRRLEHEGRFDAAVERYLLCLRMGPHIAEGITLIEGLVGVAVYSQGADALTKAMLRRDFSIEQWRRLLSTLNAGESRVPTWEFGIRNERMAQLAMVDEMTTRPLRFFHTLSAMDGGGGGEGVGAGVVAPDGWRRLERRLGRLVLPDRTIKGHIDQYFDALLSRDDAADYPVEVAARRADAVLNQIPRWDVFCHTMLPSLERAMQVTDRVRAQFQLARLTAAIRLYMKEHAGERPDKPDDLKDMVPSGAWTDPFARQPLRYEKTTEGFRLWSLSLNHRDDGGQAGERWDQLDMVVEYPPAAAKPFEGNSE